MKTLYEKDFGYSTNAHAVKNEVYSTLETTMKKWVKKGYSPKEIAQIFVGVANSVETVVVLNLIHNRIQKM